MSYPRCKLRDHFRSALDDRLSIIAESTKSKITIADHSDPFGLTVNAPKDSRSYHRFFILIWGKGEQSQLGTLQGMMKNRPPRTRPILACPTISTAMRETIRNLGWGYLDYAGNCSIVAPYFLIEQSGRTAKLPKIYTPETPDSLDLSSEYASLTVLTLLDSTKLTKRYTISKFINTCGSNAPSRGWLSEKFQLMVRDGYLNRPTKTELIRLADPARLLLDWATARAKKNRFSIECFGPIDIEKLKSLSAELPNQIALAAYSAIPKPKNSEIFSGKSLYLRAHSELRSKLHEALPPRAKDNDSLRTIVIFSKSDSVFKRHKKIDGLTTTNLLQTFSDLFIFGPHGQSLAKYLFHCYIYPCFKNAGFDQIPESLELTDFTDQ